MRRLVTRYVARKVNGGRMTRDTARSVEYALRQLAERCPDDVTRVQPRHIQAWVDEPGIAPGTRIQRLSRARAFWRWLIVEGHAKKDPTLAVEAPSEPQRLPRFLTEAQVTRLLASVPDARARLIALLMVQEGLRCCEVARLEAGDVDADADLVYVRGKGGRGDRTRVLPLSSDTMAALGEYLRQHPTAAGPLVRNYRTGRAITAKTVSNYMTDWFYAAGIKDRPYDGKSGHGLRHTMAQHLADDDVNVLTIQRALGHQHVATTQRYIRGDVGDLREAMGRRRYVAS